MAAVPRHAPPDRRLGSGPPATLKLLWTYDAGDLIDSSAAIVDGVVYVGGGDGDLLALDLATGKLRWKYATGNLIGESSPAVGPDAVYIGDLGGLVHAVSLRDGKPLWTFKTGSEIKSSPVVVGDVVLDRLLRRAPLRARRAHRQAAVEGRDEGTGARHAGGARRAGVHRRLRRASSARSASPTARRPTRSKPAPTPGRRRSSTATAPTSARSTTRCWRSI